MATFLGIYSKHNSIRREDLAAVITDFTLNGERAIIEKELPGMLLCIATKFKDSFFESENAMSFVSGHISFERLTGLAPGATAETFHRCMATASPQLAAQLEGAFAALHYNGATHTLTLLNDKFGIFPLFICENKDYVVVSNEYQPLTELYSKKERALNYDAIAEFFTLGTTLGNKTLYRQISNLPAASYTTVTKNAITQSVYWQPAPVSETPDPELLAENLFKTFSKINREYIDANVTDLCLLTAGADSRFIVSTLTDEQRKRMEFFTSNLSFLDPEEDKDVVGAALLAKKFGLQHRVEKISFYENQFGTAYFDDERKLRASHVYGGWHGGELLGGYCLHAAPVKSSITFKAADQKLKVLFSWRFRWKLKQHPYRTHIQEKEKFAAPLRDLLFMAEQLTRGFFTGIYGGTRSYWLQPYQFANNGFSPFWDSRFLQELMQVTLAQLENYDLYNQLFRLCPSEFTAIGSNSPLTQRSDSVIPKLDTGIEPKSKVPNVHHAAYMERLNDKEIWNRKFYRESKLKKILVDEFDPITKQWIDFETWYARYVR